jgi:hypothetical protein
MEKNEWGQIFILDFILNSRFSVIHKKVGPFKFGMRIAELIQNKWMSGWLNC